MGRKQYGKRAGGIGSEYEKACGVRARGGGGSVRPSLVKVDPCASCHALPYACSCIGTKSNRHGQCVRVGKHAYCAAERCSFR